MDDVLLHGKQAVPILNPFVKIVVFGLTNHRFYCIVKMYRYGIGLYLKNI